MHDTYMHRAASARNPDDRQCLIAAASLQRRTPAFLRTCCHALRCCSCANSPASRPRACRPAAAATAAAATAPGAAAARQSRARAGAPPPARPPLPSQPPAWRENGQPTPTLPAPPSPAPQHAGENAAAHACRPSAHGHQTAAAAAAAASRCASRPGAAPRRLRAALLPAAEHPHAGRAPC
eukprot:366228-Chlamydomonas_euryale.AAC.23